MFNLLGRIIAYVLRGVLTWFSPFLGNVLGFMTGAYGILTIVGLVVLTLWTEINNSIDGLISGLTTMIMPADSPTTAGFEYYYQVANTFAPVTEVGAMAVSYMGLLVALNIYRAIKSWIPTVA